MSSTSGGLIIGGVGAALGAIGAAIIQSIGGKSESRAHAADLVVTAASGLMDRTLARDTRLEEENRKLRRALLNTTDMLETLLPLMIDLPPEVVAEAKRVVVTSKLET